MKGIILSPRSKFLKVRCPKCKHEQVIFGNCSTVVRCQKCSNVIAEPTGGKARVKARILEILE